MHRMYHDRQLVSYVLVFWSGIPGGQSVHRGSALDAGADGIITDYPTRLRGILEERGIAFRI